MKTALKTPSQMERRNFYEIFTEYENVVDRQQITARYAETTELSVTLIRNEKSICVYA